jgi:hypothetical protein
MEHGNFVQETAEIIRLAETAATQASHPDKVGVVGKERLQGSEMTIDTLPMLVPACKWPAVGERVVLGSIARVDRLRTVAMNTHPPSHF